MVALAGTGLAIAAVLGVLGTSTEQRDTLLAQIVSEMTHIAQIEQNEIKEDIADAQTSLQFFATRMADDARRNPAAVRERLRELQAFDPRFLQVNLMDAEGRILVSSSVAAGVEPGQPHRRRPHTRGQAVRVRHLPVAGSSSAGSSTSAPP